jgi:iron complex outermembrane receptor protein
MRKSAYLAGASALAVALSLGASAGTAWAADAAPAEVSEVVVTGSFIKGTPEDAALPVDVIGADEIQKQGTPSTVELLKSLTVSSGVLGDTNQFDSRAQGSEGSGSVNLRGLGPQRTLVLMNGHRLAINPFGLAGGGVVDTNIIPSAAIGRLEVLKDGAAATYGSDAIAGVVNFITRTNFDGLELSGDYRYISGSDGGDYNLSATWGKVFDTGNVLVSIGYGHRGKLSIKERDWANLPYASNPEGGWSAAGNPSTYLPYGPIGGGGAYAPTGGFSRDLGCAAAGGTLGFSATTPVCLWHYSPFDNLVERTDMVQVYGEINFHLTDTTKFHGEVLYAQTDVPEWNTSPSYAALSTPSVEPYTATAGSPLAGNPATLTGTYFVPNTNPGLIAYLAQNSLTLPAGSTGVRIVANRPYGLGGNPMFGFGPSVGKREYHAFRVVGELTGEFSNGIGWDAALTWSQEVGERTGYDTLVNRYELALRGLGGEGCNPLTGVAGVGACSYYNPFSNAIPGNAITGVANPNYQSAVANSAALTRWFFKELSTKQSSKLFVADLIFNGKTGITLPGGDLAWAAGVQYRRSSFNVMYSDLSNQAVNPCVSSPDFGNNVCSGAQRNGPFVFLGVGSEADLNNDVFAGFAEFSLPFTDSFNAQIAARYEDFGGAVGSTFNPKIALRWQATDWLAFRASAGSTFRAPPDTSLTNSSVTSLQSIFGTFRAVDIFGSTSLSPEKAKTYSVGAIVKAGGLKASLDWWRFDFDNPLVTEPVAGIVATMFPAAGAGHCGDPAYAALEARFTFNGACNSANISRLKTFTINGAAVQTSGWDLLADYDFGEVFMGGDFKVGGSATYVNEYKVGATSVAGFTVAPAFDAVGLLNYQTTVYPIPQWKGEFHAEYTNGPHNLRMTVHYIDAYTDQRTAPFATGAYKDPVGATFTVPAGKTIKAQVLTDLAYRVFLPWDTTMTLTVTNIFDKDPSFARLDLNYDPFTGDPLGRTFKFGLRKKF